MNVQEYFTDYRRCKEALKLTRLLLSRYIGRVGWNYSLHKGTVALQSLITPAIPVKHCPLPIRWAACTALQDKLAYTSYLEWHYWEPSCSVYVLDSYTGGASSNLSLVTCYPEAFRYPRQPLMTYAGHLDSGYDHFPTNHFHFVLHLRSYHPMLYTVSQDQMSIFLEEIVSVILSKNLYMYTFPNLNGCNVCNVCIRGGP
jgi:hypothetical protein